MKRQVRGLCAGLQQAKSFTGRWGSTGNAVDYSGGGGLGKCSWDFPDGLVVKNWPASVGDVGLIPGLGRLHMPCGS